MAERISSILRKCGTSIVKITRSKHFSFGIPFLIAIVGGSFVFREFTKIRYEFTRVNPFDLPVKEHVTTTRIDPRKEYEQIMSSIDINNWEIKRIPRPWEEQSDSEQTSSK